MRSYSKYIVELKLFRRFLKIVYNLKPFNFKPKEIICLLNSKNMGISRLKYLFNELSAI